MSSSDGPRQIAIYGKGGIGKSTTQQNTAAALSDRGKNILDIGCDPKADCTRLLRRGERLEPVLDQVRAAGDPEELQLDDLLIEGYNDVKTVEAGGPDPGVGCGGRGVITAIETLESLGAYEDDLDYVFYDVLGDVVCGGFAMPIREDYAEEIYIVVSGEYMALYAANNIAKGVQKFAKRGYARMGGIICNSRNVERERELVEEFADRINTQMLHFIPRDKDVQRAEIEKKTVIDWDDSVNQAEVYKNLATKIEENDTFTVPEPIEQQELEQMMRDYGVAAPGQTDKAEAGD